MPEMNLDKKGVNGAELQKRKSFCHGRSRLQSGLKIFHGTSVSGEVYCLLRQ